MGNLKTYSFGTMEVGTSCSTDQVEGTSLAYHFQNNQEINSYKDYGKRKWDEVESSFHEIIYLFVYLSLFFAHANFPMAESAVLLGAERGDSKNQHGDINWDQNPELFPT